MDTTNLIQYAIDKSPIDFSNTFNDLMSQKAGDAIAARKIEVAQEIYGGPLDGIPDDNYTNLDVNIDFDGLENIELGDTNEQD